SAAKPHPNQIVRLAPPPSRCRGFGGASRDCPRRSAPQRAGSLPAASRWLATRAGRARAPRWARRHPALGSPTPRLLHSAARRGPSARRATTGSRRGPARTTARPPTASARGADVRSPHNTRLLLTPPPPPSGVQALNLSL